jgi:hypothetical protein
MKFSARDIEDIAVRMRVGINELQRGHPVRAVDDGLGRPADFADSGNLYTLDADPSLIGSPARLVDNLDVTDQDIILLRVPGAGFPQKTGEPDQESPSNGVA